MRSLSHAGRWKEHTIKANSDKPVVGILADIQTFNGRPRHVITSHYTERVVAAGGVPIVMPPTEAALFDQLALCDAVVLVGGDDPCTESFGEPTHTSAVAVDPLRQCVETMLLEHLAVHQPDLPVLGVCLGMQMMALVAGGHLNQNLPDTHQSHGDHWDNGHEIVPTGGVPLSPGIVHSMHRQAIDDPGSLTVLALAHDGVIEAVGDPKRTFYVGVQWHPERTACKPLGQELFGRFVAAAREPVIPR